jgi:hypothetical protein
MLLALNVTRVVQRGRDPAFFTLETDCGDIHIGSAEILLSVNKARAKIIAKSPYIPAMKKIAWEHCVALICQLREFETLGEGQRDTQVETWVEAYVTTNGETLCETEAQFTEAIITKQWPIIFEGRIYLASDDLKQNMFAHGARIHAEDLCNRLREQGWKDERLRRQHRGERTQARAWSKPIENLQDNENKEEIPES